MADTKFRGNSVTRVDEKGRVKIPAEFKRLLAEEQEFYITSEDGQRVQLYPMAEWEKKEALYDEMPSMDPDRNRFLDVTSYYGQTVSMDTQGRLLLPQLLREEAKLEKSEIVILGKLTILEIVNHELFKPKVTPLLVDEKTRIAAMEKEAKLRLGQV